MRVLKIGAGDRTRTGTLSPAVDFESTTSTISSHRQVCICDAVLMPYQYSIIPAKMQEEVFFRPVWGQNLLDFSLWKQHNISCTEMSLRGRRNKER